MNQKFLLIQCFVWRPTVVLDSQKEGWKSSPEQISTITLYSRKTCIAGRQHQPAGGGGGTSQEVWSPQKIRCSKENQIASRIWAVSVAQKMCYKVCLYPTLWTQLSKRKDSRTKQIVWQILLVPGTLWAELSNKKEQQSKIHFLPAMHCLSLSVMGNRYKAAVSDAIKVIFANDCKNLRRLLQSGEEDNVCLVAPLTWVNIVNLANLI